MQETDYDHYEFSDSERPILPGAPFVPRQSPLMKVGYTALAMFCGISATLPNALITVNIPSLAGAQGLDLTQIYWLPAVFVAFNAVANLCLVKGRQQFGIPAVTYVLVLSYIAATVLQIFIPSFGLALISRAINGLLSAALTGITIFSLFQVLPLPKRPLSLLISIGLLQLGTPIARLFPVEMLALHHWRGLHLIELGSALSILAATSALPMPPVPRIKAFEPLDFVTIVLALGGMLLLCGVLSVGRIVWWTDTPWVGAALLGSLALLTPAAIIEHVRARPLFQLRWLTSAEILRYIVTATLIRLALAEQTYGSVGLLSLGGLINDQLHPLFIFVTAGMIAALLVAVLAFKPERILPMLLVASLLIAVGAWLDAQSNSLSRPPQLIISQTLIGAGTMLFIGPAMVYGIAAVIKKGPAFLITFIVLFGVTQNVGGLAGSALLGSIEVQRARAHAIALSEDIHLSDPQVVGRIAAGAAALAPVLPDSGQQSLQGSGLLGQALTLQANVLAFNDVFFVVTIISILSALVLAILIWASGRIQTSPAKGSTT